MSTDVISHSKAFKTRRFFNWFPLGVAYALLYMGRYNLTVAKNSLGQLMTKEDFGIIFFWGTIVYAFSFLLNGPLVDRLGGRKGMLAAVAGAAAANLGMGLYLRHVLASGSADHDAIRLTFSVLYAANMYFQSYGAVSIVKVNARWFHVRERGGFSGIFGTMIASGIFLAFTVNAWLLDTAKVMRPDEPVQWVVFLGPAMLLAVIGAVEFFLLRDKPSDAGFEDFALGDASSGDASETPLGTLELYKRLLTNPVILTIGAIEFCTGILRNGVMHWFPIYSKEVWALPGSHPLMYGEWSWSFAGMLWVPAIVLMLVGSRLAGRVRAALIVVGALLFLTPFVTNGGWGGLLFASGVIGGNMAGWVSDLFFQSRRGPAATGLYAVLAASCVAMVFTLSVPTNVVANADAKSGLEVGDRILQIQGQDVAGWDDVRQVVACIEPECVDSHWDAELCQCSIKAEPGAASPNGATYTARLERAGQTLDVRLNDPAPKQRAGDWRLLKAQPVLPLSPYALGAVVFLISLCVIGTHGLLSGTATMDFGGRKAAGTAVGVIDGMVYLGTAVQSISLGYLTTRDWSYWPLFLIPFGFIGVALCTRIWNAKPGGGGGH